MLGRWSEPNNWWNDLDPHTINYPVDYASGYIVESLVPEPSTFALLAIAAGLLAYAWRRRKAA
jgi:hypothetical protein